MKIDDKIMHYETNPYTREPAADTAPKAAPAGGTNGGGTVPVVSPEQDAIVSISSASRETRLAKDIVTATPAVRADRVAALREKIASGAYEINPQAIADKIVDAFLDESS